jgi:hypothetical protein
MNKSKKAHSNKQKDTDLTFLIQPEIVAVLQLSLFDPATLESFVFQTEHQFT